jgi:hypothetical protein
MELRDNTDRRRKLENLYSIIFEIKSIRADEKAQKKELKESRLIT